MTAEVIGIEDGVMEIRVSGQLTQAELTMLQREATGVIAQLGRLRVLVVAEDFSGWEKGGQWDDFSFQRAHDKDVERMAIVCEDKWRDLVDLFTTKDLRSFAIQFFRPGCVEEARAWLLGKNPERSRS